jgi:hypothetical protein
MRKKIFAAFVTLLLVLGAKAQTMNVHRANGEVTVIPLNDITFVDFSEASPLVPVDLGLPSGTKWGNMNVGATKPEEYGLYFAWGETTGYGSDPSDEHSFGWGGYTLCGGNNVSLTKYCTGSAFGTVDNKTELEKADDAASVNCGGDWVMPTNVEVQELLDNTTAEWIEVNGINCRKFVSKTNSNYILLPAAGFRERNDYPGAVGSSGYYWTSTLMESDPRSAYILEVDWSEASSKSAHRYNGFSIRPVVRNAGEGK